MRGHSIGPVEIAGRTSTPLEFQQIAEYIPGLAITYVKGHAGHPLNECADSLAKLALCTSRGMVDQARAAEIAPDWARRNLEAYRPGR
ncbi:hypothetical protein PH213_20475 [Streptomyces sp. SRF1]|uniref:hypothetical protein n=1 Tax=Streptomyces sp. SRF1 TaxID=1549642 RepID=UPI0025B047D8|nr:hypothetical protein [Streptomyces sp. SRF1]MDN3056883.1 hypothetical protein [Streptomyces sp. SRF1]